MEKTAVSILDTARRDPGLAWALWKGYAKVGRCTDNPGSNPSLSTDSMLVEPGSIKYSSKV